jgi:hypothetical protein
MQTRMSECPRAPNLALCRKQTSSRPMRRRRRPDHPFAGISLAHTVLARPDEVTRPGARSPGMWKRIGS